MSKEKEKIDKMIFDREMEDTYHEIIKACGTRPIKEKILLLIDTINYIFEHNKELRPLFSDRVTLH